MIQSTSILGITNERCWTEKCDEEFEILERLYRQFEVNREKMAWFRIATIKTPLAAVCENAPREALSLVQVMTNLLMRVALLMSAYL